MRYEEISAPPLSATFANSKVIEVEVDEMYCGGSGLPGFEAANSVAENGDSKLWPTRLRATTWYLY
jgi:hypothetical protein